MEETVEKKEVKMSLDEFCSQVSENIGVSKEDVEQIIQTFVDHYIKELKL